MSRTSRRVVAWTWLVFFLGLIVGSVIWVTVLVDSVKKKKRPQPPVLGQVSDFMLTDQNADPMGSKRLRGRIWVADFIFTRCAGPCPVMSGKMAELQSALKSRPGIELVSISVDPAHDTPERLKSYGERYSARPGIWHLLTGPKEEILRIMKEDFKIGYSDPGDGPPETAIVHGTHFILVDTEGQIRGYYGIIVDEEDELSRDKIDPIERILADIDALTRR
jgi:protein SCO1